MTHSKYSQNKEGKKVEDEITINGIKYKKTEEQQAEEFGKFDELEVGDKIQFEDDVKGVVINTNDMMNVEYQRKGKAVLLTQHRDGSPLNQLACRHWDKNVRNGKFKKI